MKNLGSAILLAAMLTVGYGMISTVQASPAKNTEQTLDEAWTAYNIGQYNKVVKMVQPLASDGNPRAQVLMGRCYENGLGVPQDMETAAKWFRLAAEQNYAEAQVQLGYLYELGAGVPKNDTAVVDLMSRAANAGNAEAQLTLRFITARGGMALPRIRIRPLSGPSVLPISGLRRRSAMWAHVMNLA